MESLKYVIIMAAGHGTRMGSNVPKQFLDLEGKPILQRSIEKFVTAIPDIKVVTVLPEDYLKMWRDHCLEHNFAYPQTLVAGGITRFHSVRNALAKIPEGAIVGVHDGVRPMISLDLIRKMYASIEEGIDALIPITPSVDTLKAVKKVKYDDGTEVFQTIEDMQIDRSVVYGAQTPQLFKSSLLKKAYKQAFDTAFTDDASVAQRDGVKLDYILGERTNLKITTPEDLYFAKAFGAQSF